MTDVSIIVPAYNEADCIGLCLQRALDYLDNLNGLNSHQSFSWEIIVVDDGSEDRTADVVAGLIEQEPRISMIRHSQNLGMGAAFRSGILRARGRYVLLHPADGSFLIDDCIAFLEASVGSDMVIGRRSGYRTSHPGIRHKLSSFQNRLFSGMLDLELCDFCGVNLLPTALLKTHLPRSKSHVATIESVINLRKTGATFAEIRIDVHPRIGGRSKIFTPLAIAKALGDMLRLSAKTYFERIISP